MGQEFRQNTGQREYDSKANPDADDYGRRDRDNVGFLQVYEKQETLDKRIRKLEQSVNNGLLEATERNTKAINRILEVIEEIQKYIHNRQGEQSMFDKFLKYASLVGSGILGTLAVLWYLGVI